MMGYELVTIHQVLDALRGGRDGTIHILYGYAPDHGYMVGGMSWTMTATPENVDEEMLSIYIQAHAGLLSLPGYYLGWWTHEGRVYFDVSEHVTDKGEAHSLGVARKEIAIWDITEGKEIKCP